jgi:hypothetical protein
MGVSFCCTWKAARASGYSGTINDATRNRASALSHSPMMQSRVILTAKLLDNAQTNTMAGLNLAGRINAHKSTDRVIGSLVKARSKPSPKII